MTTCVNRLSVPFHLDVEQQICPLIRTAKIKQVNAECRQPISFMIKISQLPWTNSSKFFILTSQPYNCCNFENCQGLNATHEKIGRNQK